MNNIDKWVLYVGAGLALLALIRTIYIQSALIRICKFLDNESREMESIQDYIDSYKKSH